MSDMIAFSEYMLSSIAQFLYSPPFMYLWGFIALPLVARFFLMFIRRQ